MENLCINRRSSPRDQARGAPATDGVQVHAAATANVPQLAEASKRGRLLSWELMRELRSKWPGTAIAELVQRIASFPRECWAGAKALGDDIGRHPRTVFRYFRVLKDAGVLDRIPGARDPDLMPRDAKFPQKLRSHGYSRTLLRGELFESVARDIARRKTRSAIKKERDRERKEAQRRERRRKRDEAAAQFRAEHPQPKRAPRPRTTVDRPAFAATDFATQYPELAAAARGDPPTEV